jgi:hypothetical protein
MKLLALSCQCFSVPHLRRHSAQAVAGHIDLLWRELKCRKAHRNGLPWIGSGSGMGGASQGSPHNMRSHCRIGWLHRAATSFSNRLHISRPPL